MLREEGEALERRKIVLDEDRTALEIETLQKMEESRRGLDVTGDQINALANAADAPTNTLRAMSKQISTTAAHIERLVSNEEAYSIGEATSAQQQTIANMAALQTSIDNAYNGLADQIEQLKNSNINRFDIHFGGGEGYGSGAQVPPIGSVIHANSNEQRIISFGGIVNDTSSHHHETLDRIISLQETVNDQSSHVYHTKKLSERMFDEIAGRIDEMQNEQNVHGQEADRLWWKVGEIQEERNAHDQRLDEKLVDIAATLDSIHDAHLERKIDTVLKDNDKLKARVAALEQQATVTNASIDDLNTAFQSAKANSDLKMEQILAAVQGLAQK